MILGSFEVQVPLEIPDAGVILWPSNPAFPKTAVRAS